MNGSNFVPSTRFRSLTAEGILGKTIAQGTTVELRIRISEENIKVGHLYSFLRVLDRAYGRLLFGDLRKYAFEPEMQLSASTFERGSWEIVLTQIVTQLPNATPLLILYLLLRLLPKAAKTAASAYKTVQQGKLLRERRRAMRHRLEADKTLARLPPNVQSLLISFVSQLIAQEPKVGREALRFSEDHLMEVKIATRKPKGRSKSGHA